MVSMNMRASEIEYRKVTADEAELDSIVALFHAVWPRQGALDKEYFRWLYRENPRGTAIGMNAWCGSDIVGHYVLIPIGSVRHGVTVPAALSLNTAVHPNHQGRGLFTALAQATFANARDSGIEHVVGVANTNSTPGFIRKLGFQLVGPLRARFVTAFPECASEGRSAPLDWQRAWSAEEYRWRLTNPAADYLWSSGRRGLVWWAKTRVFGIRAIMEHRVPDEFREIVVSKARRGTWAPLRLWIGLEPTELGGLEPRGYDLPQLLRRSPLNLIFKSLQAQDAGIAAARVRFALADFDAF